MMPDSDYELWCELHPCPECDGTGVEEDGEDGSQEECVYCGGIGIDPNEEYLPDWKRGSKQ